MDSTALLKAQLLDLANSLDSPDGSGSGAIVLNALCEIEDLERLINPAEPSS